MNEKVYEEIGPNYRFFLAWRHAALAGGLVILWGTCFLLIAAYESQLTIAWLIPVLASLGIICLWLVDRRTRQIYRVLTTAGKALEGSDAGPYHALTDIGIPREAPWFPKKNKSSCKLFSQSFALDFFFLGTVGALLLAALFLLIRPPNVQNPVQEMPRQKAQMTHKEKLKVAGRSGRGLGEQKSRREFATAQQRHNRVFYKALQPQWCCESRLLRPVFA